MPLEVPCEVLQSEDLDSELLQFISKLLACRFLAAGGFQKLALIEQPRRAQQHLIDLALLLLRSAQRGACCIVAESVPQRSQRDPFLCIERLAFDALKQFIDIRDVASIEASGNQSRDDGGEKEAGSHPGSTNHEGVPSADCSGGGNALSEGTR